MLNKKWEAVQMKMEACKRTDCTDSKLRTKPISASGQLTEWMDS